MNFVLTGVVQQFLRLHELNASHPMISIFSQTKNSASLNRLRLVTLSLHFIYLNDSANRAFTEDFFMISMLMMTKQQDICIHKPNISLYSGQWKEFSNKLYEIMGPF